ncbi:hypothetical protein Bca4012_064335 [Brassica carinata]|uniref:Uncharacterized protein n=1 Tax=Brassica carinata TaxID=52824 RepID=A0A8X7SEV7_BRACI|nr:hypothetical protein Bca52824_033921 [Brassica carinata]
MGEEGDYREATHWVPASKRGSDYGEDVKSESDVMAEQHPGVRLTLRDACLPHVEERVVLLWLEWTLRQVDKD